MNTKVISVVLLVVCIADGVVFQGSCSDETSLCEQLCIVLSQETYECSCWKNYLLLPNGISCSDRSGKSVVTTTSTVLTTTFSKQNPVVWLKEKDTAPLSFNGSNYAEFPVSDSTYLETNITVEFRTSEKRDAILFFAGQFNADDYISIAIIGPNIISRHNCGEGTIEEMFRGPFTLNEWHSITVWRRFCDRTLLKIDSQPLMVDLTEQFRFYKGISMDEGMFVGGVPSQINGIENKVGTSNGFLGCIKKLIINNDVLLDTENEVNTAVNLQELEYCNPITHTVSAVIPNVREIDLSTGKLYEHENPVNTTTSLENLSFTRVLKAAEFYGSSYITLPAPTDIADYLDLRIYFKPKTHSGTLFCWHDSVRYLILFMEQGFVKVQVTMGADMAILRSELAVTLHQWHRAEVWRTGKGILMKVDRQSWVELQLVSIGSHITKPGMLYIGGVDDQLSSYFSESSGFHGCIKRIRLNGRSIQLKATNSQNIHECGTDPCTSVGCPQKCISNSEQEFLCLCEWPRYGRNCEFEARRLSVMRFSGHSYLVLEKDEFPKQIASDILKMEINLKIENGTDVNGKSRSSQLLAFGGQNGIDSNFFRLLLTQDHTVQIMMNLGPELVSLTHPIQLVPGIWTRVAVSKQKRQLTLSMNDINPITTTASGEFQLLNTHKIYIGGMPPDAQHLDGFRGCIEYFSIGSLLIDHPQMATTAINIEDCD